MVEYSIQTNHVHLIVEGADRDRIARWTGGLCVRMARGLNRVWRRRGSVFADRYHDVVLRTPRQVRNALRYVLQNARKHGVRFAHVDPLSSGRWFRGWLEPLPVRAARDVAGPDPPVARAHTWLLTHGWLRHGRLAFAELPSGA